MAVELIAALVCLGACTGFLAGLLGIGGGMVLTPFLTLILSAAGVPETVLVHSAIATSLATILFTSLSSVRAHNARGAVLPTAAVALIFVIFVGFSAVKMFFNAKPQPSRTLPGWAGLFGVGTVIGGISSVVGAGGGFISVPFMVWCNTPMHKAVGTSAALGFPIALAGTLSYIVAGWKVPELTAVPHMLGYIHWPALLSVAAASVLTAPLGARTAHRMDTKPLKRAFACLLLILAGCMLYRAVLSL